MRARIAVGAVVLVVSAGLSAAADEPPGYTVRPPRGNVTAFPIPGLDDLIVVRTQGSPIQPKGALPADKTVSRVLLREELDKRIARIVHDAAAVGTQLWEQQKNYEGTFRLYQGTVAAVQPMLDHHPKLASQALDALHRSANMKATEGAFVLREVLDAIQKETSVALAPKPLWERLGEKTIRSVVHDFVATAAKNPRVTMTRGAFKPEGKDLERLEQALVAAISEHTGGPLKPTAGAGVKDVLAGTKLTAGEFAWLQIDLTAALDKNKVPDSEGRELSDVLRNKIKEQIIGQ